MRHIHQFAIGALLLLASCDSLKNIPTNTSGGIFSLNGSWILVTSSDSSLLGSVVTVVPGVGNGTLTTVGNNNSCLRANDVKWKDIKSSSNGGFTVSNLVTACNGYTYKDAEITVLTTDQVRLFGKGNSGNDITQTWTRSNKK
jgi:hypothetical protein